MKALLSLLIWEDSVPVWRPLFNSFIKRRIRLNHVLRVSIMIAKSCKHGDARETVDHMASYIDHFRDGFVE